LFRKFIALLAGRIGQMINYQSLSDDVWVEQKTIKRWISILEASYLTFKLHPYYDNFWKRYIKSPKIYFMDTGLACRLLKINSVEELRNNSMIWNLFENMIVAEIVKQININWTLEECYFYRDSNQKEVDLIIDKANSQIPIEIKSSGSYNRDFEKWINYWKELNRNNNKKHPEHWFIIYTWKTIDYWDTKIINWKDFKYSRE
jgi:predicted AAA+ superfamily ATPase